MASRFRLLCKPFNQRLLQLSVQSTLPAIRHFTPSAAKNSFKRARPSPSPKPPRQPTPTVKNIDENGTVTAEEIIPTQLLMSAYRSKALSFGPAVATRIVERYLPLTLRGRPKAPDGDKICKEFDIKPSDLTLFAFTLIRSVSSTGPRPTARVRLARYILHSASLLNDPTATVQLYELQVRMCQETNSPSARIELEETFARLTKIAMEEQHPLALQKMGEVLESFKEMSKAEDCFRKAAESGNSEGWVRLGRQLLHRGERERAKEAFTSGVELALLNPPIPPTSQCTSLPPSKSKPTEHKHLPYLQKAAASGVIEACHNVGVFYQLHMNPPDLGLAKEWYTVAATQEFAPSGMNLAKLLKEEGKVQEAIEWLTKVEKIGGDVGRAAAEVRLEYLNTGETRPLMKDGKI
ncbi:hypothetical protein RUND412_004619 [Rhizina undulata]